MRCLAVLFSAVVRAPFAYRCVIATAISFLLLLAGAASAQQQPAGRITASIGVIEAISADGETRSLQRGDPVFEGDRLRSGPRGRAQIRFTDRGLLSLRPDSELTLDEYRDDAATPAASSQQVNLSRGGFRAQTGRIAERNRAAFRVQTPVAVIGIRGTVFDAHQEPGGALLVGATQGGVDVESSIGVIGRIGAGENFNFLRVHPDGMIEFLLESPDALSASPEIDESGDEDADESGAGDASESSVGTASGTAETTAGIETVGGAELLAVTDDPEATGTLAPAETGPGTPPTTEPIVEPEPKVALLADSQIEALLADDRIALVLGVPTATVDEAGNVLRGPTELQGGIGSFNSPLLALRGGQQGFVAGAADLARQESLAQADLFLLPDSGTFTIEEDVAGVPGLVWGVYDIPVTVFLDAEDASRSLQLNQEAIFALGSPTDIAELQGLLLYQQSRFNVFSSGLPVTDLTATGVLDVSSARFTGLIDLILGADSAEELSLLAEFDASVNGGVLENILFGVFDLFDLATETSVPAEGSLAGFFTGDAAAFLQLAFDFRVPSRSDADVFGLILLQQLPEPIEEPTPEPPPLTEPEPPVALLADNQIQALLADDRIALALGIPTATVDAAGNVLLGSRELQGGIGSFNSPLLALQGGQQGFVAGIGDIARQDLLDQSDLFLLPESGTFTVEEDFAGVPGLIWGEFEIPVTLFLDAEDASRSLQINQEAIFALGSPTAIAEQLAFFEYDQSRFRVFSSGMPVTDLTATGVLDLINARFTGLIDLILTADSTEQFSLLADFGSDVNGGVLENTLFSFLGLFDFATETSVPAEGSLAGFFTGDTAAFLQLAFDFRVPSRTDADVFGLILLERTAEAIVEPPPGLTPEELASLSEGFAFIGASCCFAEFGVDSTLYAGVASDARGDAAINTLLGLQLNAEGNVAGPNMADLLALPPALVIRREQATFFNFSGGFDAPGSETLTALVWTADPGSLTAVDSNTDAPILDIGELLFAFVGLPTPRGDLIGRARYELSELVEGLFRDAGGFYNSRPLNGASMGFEVDFADGAISNGFLNASFTAEDVSSGELRPGSATASFGGQLNAGSSFIEFDITSGSFLRQSPLVITPLDLEASRLGGFFTGNEGQAFAAAFHLISQGEADLAVEPVPLVALGLALLNPLDLSLTTMEQALFGSGLAFVAADLVPGGGTYRGRITEFNAFTAVLGLYLDEGQNPLSVLEEGFFDATPTTLIRRSQAGVFTSDSFGESFWFRWTGGQPLIADALSGDLFGNTGDRLKVLSGIPSDIADIQALGFATFGEMAATTRGVSNIPGEPRVRAASFNLDIATGTIRSGHLFVMDELGVQFQNVTGWEVFFDGELGFDRNNPFAQLRIIDGSYRGQVPIDLDASSLEGFFTGADEGPFTVHLNMAFHLRGSEPDPSAMIGGEPAMASGIFRVGNRQENRLDFFDVEAWDRSVGGQSLPGLGLAAFSAPDADTPGRGLLLGRGGRRSDNDEFVLGSNRLATFDASGQQVADTRRAEFFLQSFDFVLRRNGATSIAGGNNILPPEGGLLPGFEVGWGAWAAGPGSPRVQSNSFDPGLGFNVGPDVFFATVTPTPTSSLPRTGQVSFGGPAAFLGGGGGSIAGGRFELDDLTVSFELDFASGDISQGFLFTTYTGEEQSVNWSAGFEGFLNGAITDLSLSSLALSQGSGPPLPLDIGTSNLTGVLTGPTGQRHAGAFSFQFIDEGIFESVEGLWVIDRLASQD